MMRGLGRWVAEDDRHLGIFADLFYSETDIHESSKVNIASGTNSLVVGASSSVMYVRMPNWGVDIRSGCVVCRQCHDSCNIWLTPLWQLVLSDDSQWFRGCRSKVAADGGMGAIATRKRAREPHCAFSRYHPRSHRRQRRALQTRSLAWQLEQAQPWRRAQPWQRARPWQWAWPWERAAQPWAAARPWQQEALPVPRRACGRAHSRCAGRQPCRPPRQAGLGQRRGRWPAGAWRPYRSARCPRNRLGLPARPCRPS
jgi:hypothetical protein